MLKTLVRKFIPEPLLGLYHLSLAKLAAFTYGYPSEELIVIGVTGTNGKSTTTHFIGRLLEHAGEKVGWTTTVDFKVADREWVNDQKMTMLGRFQTQKLLREMVDAGCRYAVVETSSQGIAQYRHIGINYDVAVFTNLTPEHIEAHGGFENYKQAKGKLFAHTASGKHKPLLPLPKGESEGVVSVPKTAIVNVDDEHAGFFLSFGLEKSYGYGIAHGIPRDAKDLAGVVPVLAENVALEAVCSTFEIPTSTSYQLQPTTFHLKPIGRFNVYNALAAITACRALGLSWNVIQDGVSRLESVPGRLETISEGQPFTVIVDYAYEPAALAAVYETLALIPHNRIIHVLGSAGGGRDVARRETLGRMAAQHDAIAIVANEDPYDEDPMQIVNDVANGAARAGKRDGINLFRILDRQEAIHKAISLAGEGDLVLITGKGCEPVMAVSNGEKAPWDDRVAARKALHARGYAH